MANTYTYSRSLDEYLNDNKAEVLATDTPESDVLEEQTGLVQRNASKAEAQASQYDTTQKYQPFDFMSRYGEALVASHPSTADASYLGSRTSNDMEARALAISTFLDQNTIRNPQLDNTLRGPAVSQSSDMGVTAVTRTPNMTAPAMDEAPVMGRQTKEEEFVMTPDMEGVDTRADNTGAMGQGEAGLMEPNADIQPTVDTQATEPSVAPSGQFVDKLIQSAFNMEGGYSDDRSDTGNYYRGRFIGTNHGISAPLLAEVLGRTPTVEDMKNLTAEEASNIYKERYVQQYGIDALPTDLQEIVFHGVINSGGHAIKVVQGLLGLKQDGVVGPVTREAMQNADFTREQFRDALLNKYRTFRTWSDHGRGWTNRFNALAENPMPLE